MIFHLFALAINKRMTQDQIQGQTRPFHFLFPSYQNPTLLVLLLKTNTPKYFTLSLTLQVLSLPRQHPFKKLWWKKAQPHSGRYVVCGWNQLLTLELTGWSHKPQESGHRERAGLSQTLLPHHFLAQMLEVPKPIWKHLSHKTAHIIHGEF